jgi:hypothetical protein
MPTTGSTLNSMDSSNGSSQPLPLFRPEAIASVQQKFHGEIILIRPFPLMLLGWFALGITAAVLGFLLLGQYTERAHVSGLMTFDLGPNASAPKLQAELYVPGRWIAQLHPGSKISLRCGACSPQLAQQTGTVLEVPNPPQGQTELSQSGPANSGPVYKIPVSLSPQAMPFMQANSLPQSGVSVEAEIPLGRKPLIRWFFERSGK